MNGHHCRSGQCVCLTEFPDTRVILCVCVCVRVQMRAPAHVNTRVHACPCMCAQWCPAGGCSCRSCLRSRQGQGSEAKGAEPGSAAGPPVSNTIQQLEKWPRGRGCKVSFAACSPPTVPLPSLHSGLDTLWWSRTFGKTIIKCWYWLCPVSGDLVLYVFIEIQ